MCQIWFFQARGGLNSAQSFVYATQKRVICRMEGEVNWKQSLGLSYHPRRENKAGAVVSRCAHTASPNVSKPFWNPFFELVCACQGFFILFIVFIYLFIYLLQWNLIPHGTFTLARALPDIPDIMPWLWSASVPELWEELRRLWLSDCEISVVNVGGYRQPRVSVYEEFSKSQQ